MLVNCYVCRTLNTKSGSIHGIDRDAHVLTGVSAYLKLLAGEAAVKKLGSVELCLGSDGIDLLLKFRNRFHG